MLSRLTNQREPLMTPQTVASGTATGSSRRRGLTTGPAIAGLAYIAFWVVGLVVASSSTSVRLTGAQVIAGFAGHEAGGTAQFALTEGAASIALAVVAIAVGRAGLRTAATCTAAARADGARADGARPPGARPAGLMIGAAVTAAAIGLVQCALGVYLVVSAVTARHAGTAATLNDAITRLDGAKMFLLAVMGAAGTVMARRTGLLPRWLRWTGVALVVALVASGIGYALLNNAFALAAWVSLPLLLIWVAGAGIVVGQQDR
jgi:hypothetical protein